MFFKKLKEENKRLGKKARKLEAELAEARVIEIEMRKLLADKHTDHCHADVIEAMRSAIIRKCGQTGKGCLPWVNAGPDWAPEPHAAEILVLVTAYNELMYPAIAGDGSDG